MKRNLVPAAQIKGNTLKVYLFSLRHKTVELRDIQRALNFSSASLVSYHLNRLVEAGYMRHNEDGTYSAEKDVTSDLLEGYTRIGVNIVPQLMFLAILFTVLVGYFSYESLLSENFVMYLIIASASVVALLWYETAKLWRKLVTWT